MEKLIFFNKYLKKEYSFEKSINQLNDQKLIKILAKENYRNENCGLFIKNLSDTPIFQLLQIKINVSSVGIFLVNFEKDKFDDNMKKSLIDDISKLKTNGELTKEKNFEKIKDLLNILSNAKPLFITFSNNGNTKVSFDDFSNLTKDINFDTYLFLLTQPAIVKIKTSSKKREKETKAIEIIPFRDYKTDYIFFGIFCLILSFSLLLGLIMAFNHDFISILLFVITFAFFGVYSYAVFKYISEFNKWSFDFQKLKYPVLLSIVGIAIGLSTSFLTGVFLIKPEEDITINYGLSIGIAIPVSIALFILGIALGFVIRLLTSKVKSQNK